MSIKSSPFGPTKLDGEDEKAFRRQAGLHDPAVLAFAEELRKWWRFCDMQQPRSSWHDREDFIEKKLPELLKLYGN